MMIVIIEDVQISEDIYYNATKMFVSQEVKLFNDKLMGVSACYMVFLIIFVLVFIRMILIKPIETLTDQIVNPKKSEDINKFVKKIQDQAMKEKKEKERDA